MMEMCHLLIDQIQTSFFPNTFRMYLLSGDVVALFVKVILYSYLILKNVNERITDS